jgi:hypothetical protein
MPLNKDFNVGYCYCMLTATYLYQVFNPARVHVFYGKLQ